MATDTGRTDPQFTHGKLLEAATLLRLPVDLLADRLGLAPEPLDQLPMTTYETRGPSLSWVDAGFHSGSDNDLASFSDTSLPNTYASIAHPLLGPSSQTTNKTSPIATQASGRRSTSAGPVFWDPVTGPSTPSGWASAEENGQPLGSHHRTVDRSSGNFLSVPNPRPMPRPRLGTPSSSASQENATNAATRGESSGASFKQEGGISTHDASDEADDEFMVTKEETEAAIMNAPVLGPCSKVWVLPPRIQRKRRAKPDGGGAPKRKRDSSDGPKEGPKRRGAYTDEAKKRNTALTRLLKSCIRCRMNRGRCNPDPDDLTGPCLTCKRMTGPTLCKMPCFRYIITEALLYREQKAPFQVYSKRWQNMDIVNIPADGWASDQLRTIVISPIQLFAPFQIQVREFIPVDGDLLEEQWMTATGPQKIQLPRYAVADMLEAARELKRYIESNVWNFLNSSVQQLDPLFWETYYMAFRHIGSAQTPGERELLTNTFKLWVTCRVISTPVHICGEEKLGGHAIYSPDSLHDGKVPMPVIMTAQFECINYTTFLRPWSKAVLKQLNDLVLAKRREYWLTIYFTMFILLHSCAMLTRRDEETARQYGMKQQYANPDTIKAHQSGMQTMLAHFHFINKGVAPFSLAHSAVGRQDLAKAADLDDDQVRFVWKTSAMVQEPARAARIKAVRESGQVGDDLYWVSMLYDKEWKPASQD
ncbi:hypothetical protein V8F06_001667 [Rhypophila decipiens]